jgi:predicted deacylase
MRHIDMLQKSRSRKAPLPPVISDQTSWVRAPESGILRTLVPLGAKVKADQVIAMVADPLGSTETAICAPNDGMVIGRTNLPLVYEGDATFHIARYGRKVATVEKRVERFQEEHQPEGEPELVDDASNAPIT